MKSSVNFFKYNFDFCVSKGLKFIPLLDKMIEFLSDNENVEYVQKFNTYKRKWIVADQKFNNKTLTIHDEAKYRTMLYMRVVTTHFYMRFAAANSLSDKAVLEKEFKRMIEIEQEFQSDLDTLFEQDPKVKEFVGSLFFM